MFYYDSVLFLLIMPAAAEYEETSLSNQIHFRVSCAQIHYTSNCVLDTLICIFFPDSDYELLLKYL